MNTVSEKRDANHRSRAQASRSSYKQASPHVDGILRKGTIEDVRLTAIDLSDTTYRFRVGMRVGDLVESIGRHGQQMPVILHRKPGTSLLQLVCGFRRTAAIRELGWTSVRAIVLEGLDTDELFRLSVLENEQRKTYSDVDRANAIVRNRQLGGSLSHVARELFGLSARQAQRLLKLTTMPAPIQRALSEGTLQSTLAVVLQQLVDKHGADAVEVDAWVKRIINEKLSARALKIAVESTVIAHRDAVPASARLSKALVHAERDEDDGTVAFRFRQSVVVPANMSRPERRELIAQLEDICTHLRYDAATGSP